MTDATILIPTHRHAALIWYGVRSALAQEGASVEVFVVGDGVEDDTREALAPFLADERVRFFDRPKGERHGELLRHEALRDAQGGIVCYLSDDDFLLPDHAAEMLGLLKDADFAHSAPFLVHPDGVLKYRPIDISSPAYQSLLVRKRWNAIVLTGAAHTLDAYRRLPYGWRPAPPDIWTDLHMWRQFVALPGFRGRTGNRITALHFPDQLRAHVPMRERETELETWWRHSQQPGFREELEREAAEAVRTVAVALEPRVHDLKDLTAAIQMTRTWRTGQWLAQIRLLRALFVRRHEVR